MDYFSERMKQERLRSEIKYKNDLRNSMNAQRQQDTNKSQKEILKKLLFDRIMTLPEFGKVTFLNYRKEMMLTNQLISIGKSSKEIDEEIHSEFGGYVIVERRTEAVNKGICEFCGKELEQPAEKDSEKRRQKGIQWYNLYCCREHEQEWNEIRSALEHAYGF